MLKMPIWEWCFCAKKQEGREDGEWFEQPLKKAAQTPYLILILCSLSPIGFAQIHKNSRLESA